jgi:hypothetical protein
MRASALRSRLSSATCLLGAALLLAPPPVSAGHDDWDGDDRPRRHYRRHGHRDRHHEHGDWCPPRRGHAHGHHARGDGWEPGWYARYPVAHARYRCEPCGHWYDDEVAFHYHIHRYHHIAQAVIPLVLGAAAFGWIFYGH